MPRAGRVSPLGRHVTDDQILGNAHRRVIQRGRMAGMTLSDATTDLDELTAQLDREYVFHSWSAQAGAVSRRHRRRVGQRRVGSRGHALPRLLEPARQRQHRAPASRRHRRDPPPGRSARDDRTGRREPRARRSRQADHRARSRGLLEGLLHERRRRRDRERDPHGAPAHRSRQGAVDLPLVPRQHRRGDRRDR